MLGLNRNPSASSGQYPFSIPSWQRPLKDQADNMESSGTVSVSDIRRQSTGEKKVTHFNSNSKTVESHD